MQIAAIDLMPLLWILSAILAVALFFYGDRAAVVRTVPAACAAIILHGMRFPPRLQVVAFLILYVLCAAVYAVLIRLRRRTENAETAEKPSSVP